MNDGPDQTLRMSDAERIEALCDQFQLEWSTGNAPQIEAFLDQIDDSLRRPAFGELLKVDVSERRVRGHSLSEAEYAERFPEYVPLICSALEDRTLPADTLEHHAAKPASGLQIRCPHCHNPIELLPDAELDSISCSICGSNFSLTGDEHGATRDARTFAQVGHFKLVERLGMGAFGSVWKAQDLELDRTVAVKIPRSGQLDKQRQDFFFREARSAAQLRHPNIVPVYEVGRDGDTLYIVSELVRGITLSDRLTAGPLAAREAAELGAKVAGALHHAHEHGVIHRDLKPANIMIDGAGEPHLMDFGLARREANEITMTLDGQVLGTPAYMSPEQAQGEAHVADRRSDLYSLGVILFELLTGELPFRGNTRMMIHQVIHEEPPSPRKLNGSVPRDLETITLKCLQKEPSRRYQDADAVALELNRFQRGEPIAARPAGPIERRLRWCKRNRLVTSLIATAVGLLAGVAVVATIGYTQTSRALAEKNEAAATSDEVSTFLENLFLTSTPIVATDEYGVALAFRSQGEVNLSARELLDRGAERVDRELSDQPRVQAKLLTSMGNAYHGLGMYEKAEKLFRQALAIERTLVPANAIELAGAMHRLAVATGYAGNYQECGALLREALVMLEGAGAEGLMPATGVKQSLGMLLMAENKFSDAEPLLRQVVETREKVRGPNDASVIHGLQALAALQLTAGMEEDANGTILQMLQCASINRDGNWEKAADVVGTYQRGLHARDVGNYEQATVLLKKALTDTSRMLGDSHPFVAIIMFEYGIALDGAGEFQTAIEVLERAIALGGSLVSSKHPLLLFAQTSLVSAYWGSSQSDKADRLLEEMSSDVLAAWGAKSWQYADFLAIKALVRLDTGRPDEALSLANRALDIAASAPGSQHYNRGVLTISLWQTVANELIKAGYFEPAERGIVYAQSVAAEDPRLASWIERLNLSRAKLLAKQGKRDEALRQLRASHSSLQRQFGDAHEATIEAAEDLREAEELSPPDEGEASSASQSSKSPPATVDRAL